MTAKKRSTPQRRPSGRVVLTEDRVRDMMDEAAAKAAEKALKEFGPAAMAEFFELLGMDIRTPESRLKLRKDFEFTRRNREGVEALRRKSVMLVLGSGISAILALLYLGFQAIARGPSP